MQELRSRLAEAEETARTAERQKSQLQRLLQEFRRRLTPLQLEMQRMVEKVSREARAGHHGGRLGWGDSRPAWRPSCPCLASASPSPPTALGGSVGRGCRPVSQEEVLVVLASRPFLLES